jgi:hypothetical protein
VRDVTNLEVFKADLMRWLAIHDNARNLSVRRTALIKVSQAFKNFAEAWDDEVYEKLGPVLEQLCYDLSDLNNGRHPDIFKPAHRKGGNDRQKRKISDPKPGQLSICT